MDAEFVSLEELNFNENAVLPSTGNMEIAKASGKAIKDLYDVLNKIPIKEKTSFEEYAEGISEIKKERVVAKRLVLKKEEQKKEDEQKGFAIVSLLMIMGFFGITFVVFLTINNLIH